MKQIINFFVPGVLSMFLICCLGCYFQKFYVTNTTYKVAGQTLEQLRSENKYFIIHTPDKAFSLTKISVDGEKITGILDSLNPKYTKYLNPLVDKGNQFPAREEEMVLAEVHLYTNSSYDGNSRVILPASQISRMDVYELDKNSSGGAGVWARIGFTLGTAVVVGGSFLVLKGSYVVF